MVGAGVLLVLLAAVVANLRTRLWYERDAPRTSTNALGKVWTSQEALAEVEALARPVADLFNLPTRENAGRGPANTRHQVAALRMLTGLYRDRLVLTDNVLHFSPASNAMLRKGQLLRVSVSASAQGIEDVLVCKPIVRFPLMIYLPAALLCALIVSLGLRGMALAAALVAAVLGLSLLAFPLILRGVPALAAAAVYGLLLLGVFVAFLGGCGRKGLAAIAGGLGGLAVAVAAALILSAPLKISGFPTTTALMLKESLPEGTELHFVSLVSAGAAICLLGIVLDLGVSIAAAVEAVYRERPDVSHRAALAAGLRMNRDVTGTMLLTLFFVWAGESMHIWLLPDALQMSLRELANSEAIAVEVLGLVAAGFGLLAAGPLTALAAVALLPRGSSASAEVRSRGPRVSTWGARLLLAGEAGLCIASVVLIIGAARELSPRGSSGATIRIPRLASAAEYHAHAAELVSAGHESEGTLALWRGLDANGAHGPSHCSLARIYVGRGWFVPSYDEACKAISAMPADSDAHYVAGIALAWLGVEEEAERELRKALELDPVNANASDALRTLFGDDAPQADDRDQEDF